MKYIFLFAIFLTASCGQYEVPGTNASIGEALTANSSPIDSSGLQQICQALAGKGSYLVNAQVSFITSQRDCGGGLITGGLLVNTVIQGSGGDLTFKRTDNGLDFVFPKVDTTTSGIMAPYCALVANGQSVPGTSEISGELVSIQTSGISPTDCPPTSGEQCVFFQFASPDGQGGYAVHTKEWIRYKTNPNVSKLGFFSYRKRLTRSLCSQNNFVSYEALLQ